jgi:hypothetical protein
MFVLFSVATLAPGITTGYAQSCACGNCERHPDAPTLFWKDRQLRDHFRLWGPAPMDFCSESDGSNLTQQQHCVLLGECRTPGRFLNCPDL